MSLEECKHDFKFENLSRQELLGHLEVGDIFHAVGDIGAVAMCFFLRERGNDICAQDNDTARLQIRPNDRKSNPR
jgi:hypothetical protein